MLARLQSIWSCQSMHGNTVGSALAPLRRFYGVRVLELVVLPACIVPHRLAGLLPKLRRDRHLRIDVALHLVLIKDSLNPRGIARAHALVAGDAGDSCRGGALGTAAVLAYAGPHPVDDMLAALLAGVDVDANRLAFVMDAVVQVAGGERASGAEAVLVLVYSGLGAGDDTALEIGVALDADLEAAVAGLYAALLGDALIVAVDLALSRVDAASDGHACGAERDEATTALLLAFKAAAVLQAFDLQIATHIGDDLLAADHGSLEVGIAARLEGDGVASVDVGVAVAHFVAVGMAFERFVSGVARMCPNPSVDVQSVPWFKHLDRLGRQVSQNALALTGSPCNATTPISHTAFIALTFLDSETRSWSPINISK